MDSDQREAELGILASKIADQLRDLGFRELTLAAARAQAWQIIRDGLDTAAEFGPTYPRCPYCQESHPMEVVKFGDMRMQSCPEVPSDQPVVINTELTGKAVEKVSDAYDRAIAHNDAEQVLLDLLTE